MENKELYKNINIPNKEVEKLKQIEYLNFISEKILTSFDLKIKKFLILVQVPIKNWLNL